MPRSRVARMPRCSADSAQRQYSTRSDEAGLGNRAGAEASGGLLKPRVSRWWRWLETPKQDIGVKRVLFHRLSSAARVCSSVIGAASAGTVKYGKLWLSGASASRFTAWRTNSAIADPIEIPFAFATLRTRSATSSGRLTVIRITASLCLICVQVRSTWPEVLIPSTVESQIRRVRTRNQNCRTLRQALPYLMTTEAVPRNKSTVPGNNGAPRMSLIFSSLQARRASQTISDSILSFSHQQLAAVRRGLVF
jgi:hypothetical protein